MQEERFTIRLTTEELKKIEERMKSAGIKNMSVFLRKMALGGYVIVLDLSELEEVERLMRINANNLNQYTKRANETGSIYLEDIKEIQEQQEKLWNVLREISRKLSNIS